MVTVVDIDEVPDRFAELASRAAKGEIVRLSIDGEPALVLVALERYEELTAEVEQLTAACRVLDEEITARRRSDA